MVLYKFFSSKDHSILKTKNIYLVVQLCVSSFVKRGPSFCHLAWYLIFFKLYNCICTWHYNVNFFKHHLQSFFFMYMVITEFFQYCWIFPLGGIFVFAMVVIHPCQFHIVYDFSLTLNPCCHGFYKSQILGEKGSIF